MKYDFSNGEFVRLEDEAIDGQLDYEDFPPEEYKYFSQLARLGWLNRHKGWSKELCEQKQTEHRKAYCEAVGERSARREHAKLVQQRLIRTTALSRRLNFAKTKAEAFDIALDLIEALLEEPGLADRVRRNVKENTE